MRFREAAGRRVVARDSAEKIGTVQRYLVEPEAAEIVALEISGGRGGGSIVDWRELAGFGPDAVIVPGPESLREPNDDWERAFLEGRFDLDGKRILTAGGDELGSLRDVEFDEQSGRLTAFETTEGRLLPVQRLIAIGPYAVIVPG
jgi:uncharacterized protein YrrD